MGQIKVTPAEEDEVIVAGAAPEPAPEPELEPEPAPAHEAAPEPAPDSVRKPAPKKADSYRETTLEDLESGGMSGMQRAIIIAAIVCIIGALVYYFVAMR